METFSQDNETMRRAADEQRDALQILTTDHEVIAGLLGQLMSNTSGVQSSDGIFAQLKYELETHAAAEEKWFYPAVERARVTTGEQNEELDPRGLVRRARGDHEQIERLLGEMAQLETLSSEWRVCLDSLNSDVTRHLQFEQRDLFRLARQNYSEDQLVQLGGRILREERVAGARERRGRARSRTGQTTRRRRTGTGRAPRRLAG